MRPSARRSRETSESRTSAHAAQGRPAAGSGCLSPVRRLPRRYRAQPNPILGDLLNSWQRKGLLRDPLDYRRQTNGDRLFREAGKRWPVLSRQDRANLTVARSLDNSGLLTCEDPLTYAARGTGVFAVDLFDVIRFAVKAGRITRGAASSTWDGQPFSAGRPLGYAGSFDAESAVRERSRPLPEVKREQ